MFKLKCTDEWLKKAVELEEGMDISTGSTLELDRIKELTKIGEAEAEEREMIEMMDEIIQEEYDKDEKERNFRVGLKWFIEEIQERIEKNAKQGKSSCSKNLGETSERMQEALKKKFEAFQPTITSERVTWEEQDGIDHSIHYEYPVHSATHYTIRLSW